MTLECRSPAGEIRYWAAFGLAALALAGWFFYDARWGYMKTNLNDARKHFGGRDEIVARLVDSPQESDFRKLTDPGPASPRPVLASKVRERLGMEPVLRETRESGLLVESYASRYGVITVVSREDRIQPEGLKWTGWKHNRSEIQNQYYWALVPLIASLYPFWRLYQALTLRVTLDDSRLVFRGEVIPLADVTDLRDYSPKGWVDLHYNRDGQPRKLRLDNLKVSRFDDLVTAICEARGLANPLRPPPEPEPSEN
jgi:hypothetical protein